MFLNTAELNYQRVGECDHLLRPLDFSVDVMTSLCTLFNVSADWLLTGRGSIISKPGSDPSLSHMEMVALLVETIKQQAEEIGQLKERINQLE